jgi:hypothetical protein
MVSWHIADFSSPRMMKSAELSCGSGCSHSLARAGWYFDTLQDRVLSSLPKPLRPSPTDRDYV